MKHPPSKNDGTLYIIITLMSKITNDIRIKNKKILGNKNKVSLSTVDVCLLALLTIY